MSESNNTITPTATPVPIFFARMSDGRSFKTLLSILAKFCDLINLTFTPEGIFAKTMDPSHVAMVNLVLSRASFKEFWQDGPEVTLRLDLTELLPFLNLKTKEELELALTEVKSRTLINGKTVVEPKLQVTLQWRGLTRSAYFGRKPADEEAEPIPDPQLEFQAKFDVRATDFAYAFRTLKALHPKKGAKRRGGRSLVDFVEFSLLPANWFRIRTENNSDGTDIDLVLEALNLHKRAKARAQKTIYSTEYLEDIAAAAQLAANMIRLEYSTEMPLQLTIPLKMPLDGSLQYFLAPRVEDHEDEEDYNSREIAREQAMDKVVKSILRLELNLEEIEVARSDIQYIFWCWWTLQTRFNHLPSQYWRGNTNLCALHNKMVEYEALLKEETI